jgi:hypothetical protein
MITRLVAAFLCCFTLWAGASGGVSGEILAPRVPGLDIRVGETVVIPGATNTLAFRFNDGRLVVSGDGTSVWSHDGGKTWREGPRGPDDKTAIDLGGGEILSVSRTTVRRTDGRYNLRQRRSLDGWATVQEETAVVDTPEASPAGGDDGGRHDGLLMHHGILRLNNGDLIATMYGNYKGDKTLADGYPIEFNLRKYRTVVVFSSDRGRTWGDPVTVAYDRMLGRGADPDSQTKSTAVVPAITQEGFCEADLTRAGNGDIICAMRSGGRISKAVPIFPTPLYVSRSRDEGRTWTSPVQVADRGVCPQLVTLANGVIVCGYARPGSWLIFSDDDGRSWKGAFQFAGSDSYCNVLEVSPNTIVVLYHGNGPKGEPAILGTFITIGRRAAQNQ